MVPIINLEWIQKLLRDQSTSGLLQRGGHRHDPAPDARLRELHLPAVRPHDINFQRVPTVDTSNPFTARFIPSADESFLVIRFANPKGIDFPTC